MRCLLAAGALTFAAGPAHAAALDGAALGWPLALPFIGLLLSIALGPLVFAHVWERRHGAIAAAFAAATVVPLLLIVSPAAVASVVAHSVLLEYLPFILLLLALYTTAGGVHIAGDFPRGMPTNAGILALGSVAASVVGTTGASMILIRPLLRANAGRRHRAHIVVFFIFLVSNIGGALTPLGDPPLFLGFLRGVDFFWTTTHLALPTLLVAGLVLAVFCAIDAVLWRREVPIDRPTSLAPLRVTGLVNLVLIALAIAVILLTANWQAGVAFTVAGQPLAWQNLVRDGAMVAVTLASIARTPRAVRAANGFAWGPIREVAVLFAGIFICIAPVMAMLQAGASGPFAALLALVTRPDGAPDPLAYFWLTGLLSSLLDNAPTYLVFFETAGGDAQALMGTGALTLAAISAGAVFMGANTYIGNAPNFMVYAIARDAGVSMPSFFGYLVWSGAVLLPILGIAGWLFFR